MAPTTDPHAHLRSARKSPPAAAARRPLLSALILAAAALLLLLAQPAAAIPKEKKGARGFSPTQVNLNDGFGFPTYPPLGGARGPGNAARSYRCAVAPLLGAPGCRRSLARRLLAKALG